jgi:hypothetical protein
MAPCIAIAPQAATLMAMASPPLPCTALEAATAGRAAAVGPRPCSHYSAALWPTLPTRPAGKGKEPTTTTRWRRAALCSRCAMHAPHYHPLVVSVRWPLAGTGAGPGMRTEAPEAANGRISSSPSSRPHGALARTRSGSQQSAKRWQTHSSGGASPKAAWPWQRALRLCARRPHVLTLAPCCLHPALKGGVPAPRRSSTAPRHGGWWHARDAPWRQRAPSNLPALPRRADRGE